MYENKVGISNVLPMDYLIKLIKKITNIYYDNINVVQQENIVVVYYEKEKHSYKTVDDGFEDFYDPRSGWTTREYKTKEIIDKTEIITQHLATFNIDYKSGYIYITVHDEDEENFDYNFITQFMKNVVFDYVIKENTDLYKLFW